MTSTTLRIALQEAREGIESVRDSGHGSVDQRVQADLDLSLASLARAEDRLAESETGWSD